MDEAKRARTAETPKQPCLGLKLRAPYFYPDPRGRSSQPPRPRVMHEVLLARAAVKRSQGRPRAKY
jgi:hypothetical protein